MILQRFYDLIAGHEEWLMNRVLYHARHHNYTRYTSTLAEAWKISIQGLSGSLMQAIKDRKAPPEFGPDEDFAKDPIASFGILEAQRHRSRGITLSMFLGLMKYYKQGYIDLVRQAGFGRKYEEHCRLFIERFFDRIEIGFTVEWSMLSENEQTKELQSTNRRITNEKNKYLTLFESTPTPVIFLNSGNRIDNMNHAAATLIYGLETPGSTYYAEKKMSEPLPWEMDEVVKFLSSNKTVYAFERALATKKGIRYFNIKLKRMLDVSQKFSGIALILNDITKSKQLEDRLSAMSITDELTGLYNRRGFITLSEQQLKIAERTKKSLFLFFADLDKLKEINDQWGHQEGDKALIKVADILKETFRKSDIIGRMGGDEFAVLNIDTSDGTGETLLNRLYQSLDNYNRSEGRKYTLSLSLGLTRYDPETPRSSEELMAQADQLMYEDKKRKTRN
ncbi:MAG: GGDEF domain-containing protein [Deltaproteobacteria bacterium]|nr:GGDEF domain-containing protein [Deltaproteobacteria bacterium]